MTPGIFLRIGSVLLFAALAISNSFASGRAFTIMDSIRAAHFGDPYWGSVEPLIFSPDGRYVIADAERGIPETNRPQSTVRVYRVRDIRAFLRQSAHGTAPAAYFELTRSTYWQGPIISKLRWWSNSAGFAFLVKSSSGYDRLCAVDLKAKRVRLLTPDHQSVVDFDVRDLTNYVYTTKSKLIIREAQMRERVPGSVGTGHALRELIFPVDKYPAQLTDSHKIDYDLKDLWAVLSGRRFRVYDETHHRPVYLHWIGGTKALTLSPDAHSVVTVMAVNVVPASWQKLYLPPFAGNPDRVPAGPQDVTSVDGVLLGSEFVIIDLVRHTVRSLTNAPIGYSEGWRSNQVADWSKDGRFVVLSNSFLQNESRPTVQDAPCVAVVEVSSRNASCLTALRREPKQEQQFSWMFVENVKFVHGDPARVSVSFSTHDQSPVEIQFHMANQRWAPALEADAPAPEESLKLFIAQGLNAPPRLMARDQASQTPRLIWDPNPQLKGVDLGTVRTLNWKDAAGRVWKGALFLPNDYHEGRGYPLVIQTHGFVEDEFRPEGIYPTAFAARSLAAAGIMVLQVPDCEIRFTADEASCQRQGYEAGIKELVSRGMADQDRIGIIGFSRTCYSVLATLTRSELHFAAASITDGLNLGYLQYFQFLDEANGFYARDAEAVNDGKPFGEGLKKWVARCPMFQLDHIKTPLQVVALGPDSLLEMWEPYAGLRFLQRPVDLLILGDGTHILSNPRQRQISQEQTIDWFRFWLQDYEDPDPKKREEYTRWERLHSLKTPVNNN